MFTERKQTGTIEHLNEQQHNREPWLAVNLSYFFAGIGQIYAGRLTRGFLLIAGLILLTLLAVWQIFAPDGDILYGAGFAGAAAIVYIWNLLDAFYATRHSNTLPFEEDRKSSRDPWLAVFFSQVVPGAGHLYLRKTIPGLLLVGLYAILYVYERFSVYLGLLAVVLTAFAGLHAYFQAPVRREQNRKPILLLIAAILIYGAVTTIVPFYVKSELIRNFTTSSNYMAPTIYKGDRFFVRPLPHEQYQRGDVLVFEMPGDTTWIYLRRLIGREGDRVEIREDSRVYVNGEPAFNPEWLSIEYVPEGKYAQPGDPYRVPDDSFFLLADNPAHSEDSRHFGAVSETNVIGKAYKIYWPLARAGPVN